MLSFTITADHWRTWGRYSLLLLAALLAAVWAQAHTVNYVLQDAPHGEVVGYYLRLGFQHILPEGLDHILFVIGLCLLDTKFRTILWQATAFTVAHTITLALSMKNIILLPGAIVEPIIALSIAFIAIENIFFNRLKPWRLVLVFLFGLIHGMGFASVLSEIGLPPGRFYLSIISFNIGVELGQIAVIALVFGLIILPLKKNQRYRRIAVYPLSALIALAGIYWAVERLFL